MTINILKRGSIPAEKVYRATCRKCNSVLAFTQLDGKVVYDQRDGNYVAITCPVCFHPICQDI